MENTLEYQTQYKKTFACWEEFNREQAKLTQLGVDFFLNDEARKSDLCDNLEGETDRPKGGREGGREQSPSAVGSGGETLMLMPAGGGDCTREREGDEGSPASVLWGSLQLWLWWGKPALLRFETCDL